MTYENPRPIAILMAVYNGERFMREQIDSILAQTNQEWTLYIRNDGSTDRTADIIDAYVAAHDNIVAVDPGGPNLGCRGNFFRLLEVVESEYYMFSDADDVWLPQKVEWTIAAMRELDRDGRRPVVVHSDYTVTDAELNVLIPDYWKHVGMVPERFYSYNLIAIANPVSGAEMCFNHVLKTYLFPLAHNTLLHDRWIPMVAARHGAIFKAIHKPTLLYRQHGDNIYGIKKAASRGGLLQRLRGVWEGNRYVARKLVDAGYGSYWKYAWYKLVYTLKRHQR